MSTDFDVMLDTIGADAKSIPTGCKKIAGYDTGTGDVPWTDADWNAFPDATHVHIDQQNSATDYVAYEVGDVESGALTIGQFITLAQTRQQKWSYNTVLYVSLSNASAYTLLCKDAGLNKLEIWLADWSLNQPQAVAKLGTEINGYEVVAVQWASPSSNPNTVCPGSSKTLKELNVDLSVTQTDWFPVKTVTPPEPVTPPAPVTPPVVTIDGYVVYRTSGLTGKAVQSTDNGVTWH